MSKVTKTIEAMRKRGISPIKYACYCQGEYLGEALALLTTEEQAEVNRIVDERKRTKEERRLRRKL